MRDDVAEPQGSGSVAYLADALIFEYCTSGAVPAVAHAERRIPGIGRGANVGPVHGVRTRFVIVVARSRRLISIIFNGIAGTLPNLIALDVWLDYILPHDLGAIIAGVDESFVVILRILYQAQTDLLQVALATGTSCIFSRPREDGKEDGSQDSNNGNDYQKFDQGETLPPQSGAAFASTSHLILLSTK
jgi:hypothetical protein